MIRKTPVDLRVDMSRSHVPYYGVKVKVLSMRKIPIDFWVRRSMINMTCA